MSRQLLIGIALAVGGAVVFGVLISSNYLAGAPQVLTLLLAVMLGFTGWWVGHPTTFKLFWPFLAVWLLCTHMRLMAADKVSYGVGSLAQICLTDGGTWCSRSAVDPPGVDPGLLAMRKDIRQRRSEAALDPNGRDTLGEVLDATFIAASLHSFEERNASFLDVGDDFLAFYERAVGTTLRPRRDCLRLQHSIVRPDTVFLTRLEAEEGVQTAGLMRHPWVKGLARWHDETWAFLAVPPDAPIGTSMLPFSVSGATCRVPLQVVRGDEHPLSLAAQGTSTPPTPVATVEPPTDEAIAAITEEPPAPSMAPSAPIASDDARDAQEAQEEVAVAPLAARPSGFPVLTPGMDLEGSPIDIDALADSLVGTMLDQVTSWSVQQNAPPPGATISPLVDSWVERNAVQMPYSQRLTFMAFRDVAEMLDSKADVKAWALCAASTQASGEDTTRCEPGQVIAAVLVRDDALPTRGHVVAPPPIEPQGWTPPDRGSLHWSLYRHFMFHQVGISLLHLVAMLVCPLSYYMMLQRECVSVQGTGLALTWPPLEARDLRKTRLSHLLNLRGDLDPPLVYLAFALVFGIASSSMFAPLGVEATALRDFLLRMPDNTGQTLPSWVYAFTEAPPLVVGFAGYQLYAGLTFGRGLLSGTLGPETFVGLTVRGASVILIGMAVGLAGFDALGPAGLVAFMAGAFPMHAWMLLSRVVSQQLNVTAEGSLHKLPSDPTLWQQSALGDAGISTVNDLARADLERLFSRVGLETPWLLQALDEALLLDGLDASLAEALAKQGITRATSLMVFQPEDDDPLEQPVRQLRDNLLHSANYRQIHAWLRPQTPLPEPT
jgi:hypothetical protein